MADDNNMDVAADTAAADATVAVPTPKKTRKPRTPKAASGAVAAGDVAASEAPQKKTRAKRGSKVAALKDPKGRKAKADTARAYRVTAAVAQTSEPTDEFADLIKLEEENKSLRKQLSEKLRAENADLKKRLGQS